MPGDMTDTHPGAHVDPPLAEHKLPAAAHEAALTPVLGGEMTGQDEYLASDLPTEVELHSLRRVPFKIPWKVYTIAFVELVERMSFYGTTAVFVNFIQQKNPGTLTGAASNPSAENAQPGALGMGQRASTGITTFNQFWCYLMPILGAFIADTWLGRFKTIVYAVVIAEIGHVLLTVSASPASIAHTNHSLGLFLVGLVIMGVGTGGFKPNISPLVAEQVPQETMHVRTTKDGERVIVDPAATTQRIYNYFYMFINVGALVGQLGMSYSARYIGFWLAYFIPTVFFLTTFPVLFFCRKYYVLRKPEGSVLGPAIRLLILGQKGRWHLNPLRTYKHLHDGTFWESVKPSRLGANKPQWMKFDDHWVDEVSRGWKACSVLSWFPLYWITYNQINNNLTSQAATMQLHGLPNDVLTNLDPLALIILIPVFDLVVMPFLRRRNIRFTPIKRIAAGFFLGSMAMVWACVIQSYIYHTSPCGKYASGLESDPDKDCRSSLNVWLQTGSYVLIAISEILASITSLDYAYTKAPKNMRSLVQAYNLLMTAISAAIGEALVSLSADPLLVWNYGSMAVISFVAGICFWQMYRTLDHEEDRLNMLPTGHVGPAAQSMALENHPGSDARHGDAPPPYGKD